MSPQAGFLLVHEIVPRLRAAVPKAVRRIGCEDVAELVQDGTVIAAGLLHRAEKAGKRVSAGNIAYYTIQLLRSGRRSTGSSAIDVMQPATQLKGRTQLLSLQETFSSRATDEETFSLAEVLFNDHEDPSVIAGRKLDWQCFCETQPGRHRAILQCTAAGEPLTQVARRYRVCRSTIQANKDALAREIKAFMGEDILQETARLPFWRHHLAANREKAVTRKSGTR